MTNQSAHLSVEIGFAVDRAMERFDLRPRASIAELDAILSEPRSPATVERIDALYQRSWWQTIRSLISLRA